MASGDAVDPEGVDGVKNYRLLLIQIVNFPQLWDAYGESLRTALNLAMARRLEGLALRELAHAVPGQFLFIQASSSRPQAQDDDLLCEHLSARLSFGPISCNGEEAFLEVEIAVIRRAQAATGADMISSGLADLPFATAFHEGRERRSKSYRADMFLAINFYSRLSTGGLSLTFGPVASGGANSSLIYWKTSVQQRQDSGVYGGCATDVLALEAVGMESRLDRSVLVTVLELLSQRPHSSIACSVSARSLVFSAWWRLFFRRLQSQPERASRLIIEISETRMISEDEEAITLLRTLRIFGCKIAVTDVGSNGSTYDFLSRLKPDIITLNINEHGAQESGQPLVLGSTYQNLIRFCNGLAPCVVTEGIDTEGTRMEALAAGSGGMHGAYVGSPGVTPDWHNQPAVVWDAFERFASPPT